MISCLILILVYFGLSLWFSFDKCSATAEVLEAGRATIDLNAFKDTLASGLAAK